MTRAHRVGVLAILVCACACGGASTSDDGTTPQASTGGDFATTTTTSTTEPCTGSCREGDACTRGPDVRCACSLHYDVNCGGAPRQEAPPAWAWACEPVDGTTDRGDGCPYAMPAEGTACAAARTCRYPDGACGWNGTDATCADGSWHHAPFALPPPP